MKISQFHEDRIEAFVGMRNSLLDYAGEQQVDAIIGQAQTLARNLISAAEDDADQGRLTHAIDCVRAAIEGLNAATDIGHAKKRRLANQALSAARPSE